MEKEKFLVNNDDDKEIKVNVKKDDLDELDYSDDFYEDYDDEEECSCDCDDDCCCDGKCTCHDYNEQMIDETFIDDFEPQVVERGENYYFDGHVLHVFKNNNKYYAKVLGSKDEPYNVEITIYDEDNAEYDCDCPYEFPCKHAYATLMAIANNEYKEVELKKEKREKEEDLSETIKKIPAEELKEYLLSDEGKDNVCIETSSFNNHFRKYLPKQDYEFYYNRLYNEIMLDDYFGDTIDEYLDKARKYLQVGSFEESFAILKSIVEALNDTNVLNTNDEVFDVMSKIGMLLRIINRKALNDEKKDIKEWESKLKDNNYYNNYYLEDVILTLK